MSTNSKKKVTSQKKINSSSNQLFIPTKKTNQQQKNVFRQCQE